MMSGASGPARSDLAGLKLAVDGPGISLPPEVTLQENTNDE